MEWKYMLVYNGECDSDSQGFADSIRAGHQYASELTNPMFVDVSGECYEYVVIYNSGDMPEDTNWLELIEADGEQEYSL